MAQRGIRERDAKKMLAEKFGEKFGYTGKVVLVSKEEGLDEATKKEKWLKKEKLVVKPDQLFGKRGKNNLLLLNAGINEAKKFIEENLGREITLGKTTGKLSHFLAEPFVPHKEEFYLAMRTERDSDIIYFSEKGGIDVEENWKKVKSVKVPVLGESEKIDLTKLMPKNLARERKEKINEFAKRLLEFFREYNFAYFEINPFTFDGNKLIPLDVVAKLDDTAGFESGKKWGQIEFPTLFGRETTKEEEFIKQLDEKSGSSLKLTVLNPEGRIWTIVAGGGASIIYADTVCDLGYGTELANYGEYSGNPTEEETYQYAKTVMDLMTRKKDAKRREKILLIAGGIANFTDVAKTFKGIIRALTEFRAKLKVVKAKIYVRRGGPNYQEGLKQMGELGEKLGLPIKVFGPETHMTKIVGMALGERK